MGNQIIINGKSYSGGRNISIINNRVIVDGQELPGQEAKEINISITGNVSEIRIDACNKLSVEGNVESVTTTSGDVECGNVGGSVKTISGDVRCEGSIGGSVSTISGSIKSKK